MADISPFPAVRYSTPNLDTVVAPPYDVISPAEQDALYQRDPHNVVRLILGREMDKYDSAARFWQQWLSDGTLVQDPAPAVYVYRQTFQDPLTGQPFPERVGLVCLLKLEPYGTGKVFPHEHTLPKHKADRLELTRTTQAQMESIYGLYSDPDRAVQSFLGEYDEREPVMETVADAIGSSHRVERIVDENAVTVLQDMMRDKAVFIADGHHRYETALNFQREWRAAHPEVSAETPVPADYILVTLSAFEDEGLLVLPTHRLVRGVDAETLAALPETLAEDFEVEEGFAWESPLVPIMGSSEGEVSPRSGTRPTAKVAPPNLGGQGGPSGVGFLLHAIEEKAAENKIAFGLLLPGNKARLLVVRDIPDDSIEAVERLPVTLLQRWVLERRLGIRAEQIAAGEMIAYTRDAQEAQDKVHAGEYGTAFLLPRPAVSDVRDVSLAGDVMPQKSTFFFPKLLSGLIMRNLTDNGRE